MLLLMFCPLLSGSHHFLQPWNVIGTAEQGGPGHSALPHGIACQRKSPGNCDDDDDDDEDE